MSLQTYAALQAAVADWAAKTDLTAQIPDFVAWAHQEICRRLRAPLLYARVDVTIDGESVAAPSGFLAARRFFIDATPRRLLHLTDSGQLVDLTLNMVPGAYPTHFAVEGTDTLAFAPLFNGSLTGKLLYYKAPAALAADADTNVVLTKYPFLYLYGALEALHRYLEDDNNCDRYAGLFASLLTSINDEEAKDAARGPLVGTPGVGAVV